MAVTNRKEIEKLIIDVFNALDPTGHNGGKYKTIFADMNDTQFEKHMKTFLEGDDNFILDIVEFENSLKFEHCEAAAKVLGIPLMEYVYMPHLSMDKENVVVSKERCLVGFLNIKRLQQLIHEKNHLSTSNENRSAITGQVKGDDKNARDSDTEATLLVSLGADKILRELHGPRSDDPVMRTEMMQKIHTAGHCTLEELTDLPINKVALNTANAYFLSMGLKSDLVSKDYILPKRRKEIMGQ